MRVLLIAGGWSSERDVSLAGAHGIQKALVNLGHHVDFFDPSTSYDGLIERATTCDFAFLNLHGSPGEDGVIQAMLDALNCPYQGTGPSGSLRALNKAAAKELFRARNIPTPDWVFLPTMPTSKWNCPLSTPLFLKPNTGGSSVGATKVMNKDDLLPALNRFFAIHQEALLEPFIPGQEVTCAVLDDKALPLILIRPKGSDFFDYQAKYTPKAAEEICPAPLNQEITVHIQDLALQAHQLLGLADYSRADFILNANGPWLLEVNTLPGMTTTSLLPQSALAVGLSFDALIARLIELGLRKKK